MARKTKQEAQKTRDAILDAAEHIFLAKGVAYSTMNDIALAAGLSRGAVYGHYSNKVDVCLAMVERAMQYDLFHQISPSEQPLETLLQAALYYLELYVKPGSVQRVGEILYFKCEETAENRPILRWRKLIDRYWNHYVRRQLRSAIARGELPGDLDLRLCSLYLSSVFDGVYSTLKWAHIEGITDPLPDCERMLRAALAGLAVSACNQFLTIRT